MRIIDAHAHIFPGKIAPAAVKATSDFYFGAKSAEMPTVEPFDDLPGTPADLATREAAAGIGRAMVFSSATAARQVESINSFIAETCREYPQFIGVGTMHIDYPDPAGEVERMRSLGLVGVKLHPDIQHFDLDDDRLLPFYEAMLGAGMFLVAHVGDFRYSWSSPSRMARLAKLFPEMRFISAHFGGWSQWAAARECLMLPNVYVDTSSTLGFGGWEAARNGLKAFDPTHIFFGTDYPMWDPGRELERFLSLGVDEKLLPMVLGENLAAFLAI